MISRAEFEAYNKTLDNVVSASQNVTRSRILAWLSEHPQATVAEKRDAAIEILDGGIQVSSNTAATVAAEWYDEQAFASGLNLDSAITSTVYDREAVEEAVHSMARHLAKGETDEFLNVCAQYAADRARRSANMTVLRNAYRDRNDGVRFARVPTGAETCAFCYMLATRGAVYWTRRTAGEMSQFHHHCDCKIVPGFNSDKYAELVEGWKPDKAYDRLKSIEKECGVKVGTEWRDNDFVTRSMRLRDSEWLFFGKDVPQAEREIGAHPEPKERNTDALLRQHGIRSFFRKPLGESQSANGEKGHRTSDVFFVPSPDKSIWEKWEFKCPDGNSSKAIKNQLKKASGYKGKELQCDKLVISNVNSKLSFEEMRSQLFALDGQFNEIKEVILISKNGEMLHYNRRAKLVIP
jgi:hypothetical protein